MLLEPCSEGEHNPSFAAQVVLMGALADETRGELEQDTHSFKETCGGNF